MATPRIRLRDAGGTLRTITQIRMRDSGGTLRTITRVRMRDTSNTLRIVYDSTGASTFSVSISPSPVGGTGTGTVTTASTTATPSGGTAPYTYAWSLLTYSAGVAPTATSPTGAATTFRQTGMSPGEHETASWRVTVTDSSVPALTATADVNSGFTDIS